MIIIGLILSVKHQHTSRLNDTFLGSMNIFIYLFCFNFLLVSGKPWWFVLLGTEMIQSWSFLWGIVFFGQTWVSVFLCL